MEKGWGGGGVEKIQTNKKKQISPQWSMFFQNKSLANHFPLFFFKQQVCLHKV